MSTTPTVDHPQTPNTLRAAFTEGCPKWGHSARTIPGGWVCAEPGCAGTSADLLTAASVRDLVASLPPWAVDQDDDPAWVRSVHDVGLTELPSEHHGGPAAALRQRAAGGPHPAAVRVAVDRVWLVAQPFVRLDALAHYLSDAAGELWDRDGWFGNDLPVLGAWPLGGYLVLDGTHRVAAHRLRGDATILAHVLTI